jgi:protein phosphatase
MAQESTANQSQEKRVRLVRPSLILLCGPAACGKSTFAQRHFRPTQIISSDWARGRVCDDERDQRFQTQAFALVHYLTELRLGLNRLCVVDSTALTAAHRKEYLDLAKRFHVPGVVFLFNVPLEKCIERDQARERTVGKPVIERQHQAFEQVKADIRQEGFDQIVELADDDMDKVQIEVVFRPVPLAAPAPPREVRHAPRPWPTPSSAAPAPHQAKPAAPAQAAGPAAPLPVPAPPAKSVTTPPPKPEPRQPASSPQPPSVPPAGESSKPAVPPDPAPAPASPAQSASGPPPNPKTVAGS